MNRLRGSRRSTVFRIDSTGVIPDPATNATSVRAASGCTGTPKRPSGVITASVSPTCSVSFAQLEKAPPVTRLIATRNSPSSRPAQME